MNRLDDGGRIAARGLQYQYLRTLEAMLDHVETDVAAVRIEGPVVSQRVDAVDFDIVGPAGEVRFAAQVKSAAPGRTVSAAMAYGQLADLIKNHDAASYGLLTNARAEPSAVQLAATLGTQAEPAELRQALVEALSNAPARRAQVQALSETELSRLSRAQILFDTRDDSEIRAELRDTLRAYRIRTRDGLGVQSAGLLLHALLAEILRRAADSSRSAFTMDELREHLLIDSEALAYGIGSRDWGVVVGSMPPIPDIARPELFGQVVVAFATRSPVTPLAVLVGPSGIGKSSLAAAYVADQADAYDIILWLDGESDRSLTAGFRLLCTYLAPAGTDTHERLSAEQLRTESHAHLARFPGRWLLVIDNVTDPRGPQAWIPRLGHGDAILTTIDAAAPYGTATVIPVDVMNPTEATALLRRRLRLGDEPSAEQTAALHRLGDALSHWPLALELAAGYLTSCGIALDAVDQYLDQLKNRALADEYSVPPGYPRPLAAAIGLCLQRIRDHIAVNGDDRPALALGMLCYAAFLGSRQIPIHLLAAAVVVDLGEEPDYYGPIIPDPAQVPVAESVRELRRYSLVAFDVDLPQTFGEVHIDAQRTITMNSIVQHILRSSVRTDDDAPAAFDRLAGHVERWLTAALQLNLLQRADVMFTHADALARHLRHSSFTGDRIALLFGNLAGAYRVKGDIAATEQMLHTELDLLGRSVEPNELLVVQVKLSLAEIALQLPDQTATSVDDAVKHLEHVLHFAQRISANHPEPAARLLHHASRALESPAGQAVGNETLAVIRDTCLDLLRYIGPTAYTSAVDEVLAANTKLTEGDHLAAEHLCQRVLAANILTGIDELYARRLLVEAMAAQRRWSDAHSTFEDVQQCFGTANLHGNIVSDLVHNTGRHCAMHVLLLGNDRDAIALLTALVTWPPTQTAHAYVSTGYQARLQMLAAINAAVTGDQTAAHTFTASVPPADLFDGSAQETAGWLLLWQLLRAAAIPFDY